MGTQWATFYKYVSLNRVPSILDKHRLFLNDGTNFNDPFEVTITQRKSGCVEHIRGLHILSLTSSYQNKLIWSHYTDSHKGVCLTVKVPSNLAFPICYTGKRVYDDSDIDQILANVKRNRTVKKNVDKPFALLRSKKRYAYIKDQKWSYEKEYRIVFDETDECHLIYEDNNWYMPVKITNVYLGVNFCRNDAQIQQDIMAACKRNRVKITQMKLSDSDYSVRPMKKKE